jgi:hypothetical protein
MFSVVLVYLAMLLKESTVILLVLPDGVVPVDALTIRGEPIFNEGIGNAVVDVLTKRSSSEAVFLLRS